MITTRNIPAEHLVAEQEMANHGQNSVSEVVPSVSVPNPPRNIVSSSAGKRKEKKG